MPWCESAGGVRPRHGPPPPLGGDLELLWGDEAQEALGVEHEEEALPEGPELALHGARQQPVDEEVHVLAPVPLRHLHLPPSCLELLLQHPHGQLLLPSGTHSPPLRPLLHKVPSTTVHNVRLHTFHLSSYHLQDTFHPCP